MYFLSEFLRSDPFCGISLEKTDLTINYHFDSVSTFLKILNEIILESSVLHMFYIGDSVRFFSSEIPDIFEICQIIFSHLLHYRVASPWEIDVNSRDKRGGIRRGEPRGEARCGAYKGCTNCGMFKGLPNRK